MDTRTNIEECGWAITGSAVSATTVSILFLVFRAYRQKALMSRLYPTRKSVSL